VASIDDSPCPSCGAGPGTLSVQAGPRLQARPLGSFSLAGAQMKVAAAAIRVLHCSACGLEVQGRWGSDGQHVVFPATPPG
jgi:hypothetical protein